MEGGKKRGGQSVIAVIDSTLDQHRTNIRPTLGQYWTVTIRKCDTNQIDSYNHDTDTSNFLTFRSTEHVRDHVEMSWRCSHQVATD